ncbi:MAG TPA: hypothetical protein VGV59_01675 [Pyrinomonadaceae bacterium]|nr:hypothetical protein [Pyrinomonadaceae bacterium]
MLNPPVFSSPHGYKKLLAVAAWSGALTEVVGALAAVVALTGIFRG